jgi:hypothetical protein
MPSNAKVLIYHDMAILVCDGREVSREGYGGGGIQPAIDALCEVCREVGRGDPVVWDNRQEAAARRVALRRMLRVLGCETDLDGMDEGQLRARLASAFN